MRFVVQTPMQVAKKSASSVYTAHPNPLGCCQQGPVILIMTTQAEPRFASNRVGGFSLLLDNFAQAVQGLGNIVGLASRRQESRYGLLVSGANRFSRLAIFTGRDGFQVPPKVLKVILCSDFPGFHIVHHFPRRDSRLTGSQGQRELPAAIQARMVVKLPFLYGPRK